MPYWVFLTKNIFFGKNWAGILFVKSVYLQHFARKKILNLAHEMPILGVLGIEFENNIVYLKSAPSRLSNCKILVKKNPIFVTKNA